MKTLAVTLALTLLALCHAQTAEKPCSNTNSIPKLLSATNLNAVLQAVPGKASPQKKEFEQFVSAGKAPTREAADRILAERSESLKWMADDRTHMVDLGLRMLAHDIPGFGRKADPVWVREIDMGREVFHAVFLVNARTGGLLQLP